MSVNGVNSTTHKKGFFGTVADSVVTQGKNMLVGGAIGLATGKVVSLAAPVSRAKIADEVFDHYVKNNKDNIADSIKQFENLAKNENLTKEHVQLLIGRVGSGSSLWMNGDFRQTDSHIFRINNGLLSTVQKLAGHEKFGYVRLEKTERSETAAMADLLD